MNWRLALATFAVLPLIMIATWIFRDRVRDANRRIRTAIARINSFLQEHISGMSIVQIFNRETKIAGAIRRTESHPHGSLQGRDHGLRRLLPGGRIVQHDGHRDRFLVRRTALVCRRGDRRRR